MTAPIVLQPSIICTIIHDNIVYRATSSSKDEFWWMVFVPSKMLEP